MPNVLSLAGTISRYVFAVVPQAGRPGWRRVSRLVTLPDYQGLGIGSAVLHAVAEWLWSRRLRTSITTSHPAMIACLRRSSAWRITRRQRTGRQFRSAAAPAVPGRWVVSAEYWPIRRPASSLLGYRMRSNTGCLLPTDN